MSSLNTEINLTRTITNGVHTEYDEIPDIHRTLTNLGSNGSWIYWKQLSNGKWIYNPVWVNYELDYQTLTDEQYQELCGTIPTLLPFDDKEEHDEIPSFHKTFADLDENGMWTYWRVNRNGKYVWCPIWIKQDDDRYNRLVEVEKTWRELLYEEEHTPKEKQTTEWYQSISGRKRSAYTELTYYQDMLQINV